MTQVEKLAELADFTNYQKKVYKAVYTERKANVRQIAKESSVPKPKAYTALDQLHGDGFVALEAEDPKTYSIIDPKAAFNEILAQEKERIRELENTIEKTSQKSIAEEERFLKILRGKDTVLEFLADQLKQAEDEYVTLARFVSSSTPLQPVMKEKADTIEMKFLGPEKHSRDYVVEKYRKIGIETRLKDMESVPFRFSIYDDDKLALTLSDEKDGYVTVWTNYPSFVDNIKEFFEYHWNNAE